MNQTTNNLPNRISLQRCLGGKRMTLPFSGGSLRTLGCGAMIAVGMVAVVIGMMPVANAATTNWYWNVTNGGTWTNAGLNWTNASYATGTNGTIWDSNNGFNDLAYFNGSNSYTVTIAAGTTNYANGLVMATNGPVVTITNGTLVLGGSNAQIAGWNNTTTGFLIYSSLIMNTNLNIGAQRASGMFLSLYGSNNFTNGTISMGIVPVAAGYYGSNTILNVYGTNYGGSYVIGESYNSLAGTNNQVGNNALVIGSTGVITNATSIAITNANLTDAGVLSAGAGTITEGYGYSVTLSNTGRNGYTNKDLANLVYSNIGGTFNYSATNSTNSVAYVNVLLNGSGSLTTYLNTTGNSNTTTGTNVLYLGSLNIGAFGTLQANLANAGANSGRVALTNTTGMTFANGILAWAVDTSGGGFLTTNDGGTYGYLMGEGASTNVLASDWNTAVATSNYKFGGSGTTNLTANNTVNSVWLQPGGASTMSLGANTLTVVSGGFLLGNSGSTSVTNGVLTAGNGSGAYTLYLWDTGTGALTIGSTIADNGANAVSVVKAGTGGPVVISGSNSYTGGTYVESGVLALTNGGNLASSAVTVSSGGAFSYYGGTYGTVNAGSFGTVNLYASGGSGITLGSNSTLNLSSTTNSSNSLSFNNAFTIVQTVSGVTNVINVSGSNSLVNGYTGGSATAGIMVGKTGSTLEFMSADGSGSTTFNNYISGTTAIATLGMRHYAGNLKFDSGYWYSGGNDRLGLDGNATGTAQTFTIGGGTVTINETGYGIRFASDNGVSGGGTTGAQIIGTQTNGVFNILAGGIMMGSTSAQMGLFTLSGGLLNIANGNSLQLGSDTAGSGTTTFSLGGGTLSVSGTISGSQGSSAKQDFVWNGGALSFGTLDTTKLAFASNTPTTGAASTFTNSAGNLLVGNTTNGYAGQSKITGNYQQSGSSTATFNILGSTASSSWTGAASQYSQLTVSGTTLLGGNIILNFGAFGVSGANSYNIIASTGALSGSATLAGANSINGYTVAGDGFTLMKLTTNANTLVVTNSGLINEWTGGTATWDATTNAWSQGINPSNNAEGAYFGANGQGGTVTVSGNKTISSLVLSNATSGYTLASSGSPTITLGNSYGATIMNYAGSHTVTPAISLVTNLTVGNSGTLTLAGNLSGTASVTATNGGLTILSGSNGYTGVTTIGGGYLDFQNSNALYGGSNALWTAGNIVVQTNAAILLGVGPGGFSSNQIQTLLTTLTNSTATTGLEAGASFGIDASGTNFTLTNNLANSAAGVMGIAEAGTGTLTLNGSNSYTGMTTLIGGTLLAGSTNSFGTGTLSLTGGVLNLGNYTFTNTLGTVTGGTLTNGTLSNNGGTFTFNNAGAVTVAANLVGSNALTQSGSGTTTLSGNNSYGGATIVSAGQLSFTGSSILTNTTTIKVGNGVPNSTFYNSGNLSNAGGFTLANAAAAGSTNIFVNAAGAFMTNAGAINIGNNISSYNIFTNAGTITNNGAVTLQANSAAGTNILVNSGTFNSSIAVYTIGNAAASGYNLISNSSGTFSIGTTGTSGTFYIGKQGTATNILAIGGGVFNNFISQSYLGYGANGVNLFTVASGATANLQNFSIGAVTGGYNGVTNLGAITMAGNISIGTSGGNSPTTNSYMQTGGSYTGGNSGGSYGSISLQLGSATNATNILNTLTLNGGSMTFGGNVIIGADSGSSTGTNTMTLGGGTLVNNGFTFRGGSNNTTANSFLWTNGTLSAATISTTNGGWSTAVAGSSISNNTLFNTNSGNLLVGNITNGYAGKTAISGNYTQSGSATTTFNNLFGTNQASTWAGNTNQYSLLAITGTAQFGGQVSVNIANTNGFDLANSNAAVVLTNATFATSGSSLTNATLAATTTNGISGSFKNATNSSFNAYSWLNTNGYGAYTLISSATNLTFSYATNSFVSGNWGSGGAGAWSLGVDPNSSNAVAYFNNSGATAVSLDQNRTIGGMILTNTVALTLSGSSTLTLNPSANLGTTALIRNTGGNQTINAPLSLGGTVEVTNSGTQTVTLGGAISGNGGLQVDSNGALILTGADTASGQHSVNRGAVLTVTNAGSLSGGALAVNGSLNLGSSANSAPGLLTGNGAITQSGPGTLTLASGNNSFSGTSTLNGGGLVVGYGSTFAGTSINQSGGSLAVAGKVGAINTSGGSASISGTAGNITLSGGAATVSGTAGNVTATGGLLSGSGTLSTLTVSGTTATVAPGGSGASAAANLTVSGLVLNGGIFNLNLFGGTSIDTITSTGGITFGNSPVTLAIRTNSFTSWDQTQSNSYTIFSGVNGFSGTFSTNNFNFTGSSAVSGSWSVTTNSTSLILVYTANSTTVTVTSLTGTVNESTDTTQTTPFNNATAPLLKVGAGEYVLDMSNSYGMPTYIAAGTLTVATNGALGASPSVFLGYSTNNAPSGSNSVLQIANAGQTVSQMVSIAAGTAQYAVQNSSGGTVVLAGGLTLNTNATLSNAAGGNMLVSSAITGGGALNVSPGSGTVTLAAGSSYNGGTTLNGGTLALSNSTAMGMGTLALSTNATVQALANENVGNAVTVADGGNTLTLDANGNSLTNSGNISGTGASVTAHSSTGTGTLTLSGSNSYTGASTVNSGTLALGSANALPSSTTLNVSGTGTLNLSGYNASVATLADGGSFTGVITNTSATTNTLTVSGANASSFGGTIAGALGLTKSGSGTLSLGGTNSYSGATLVNGGGLVLNGSLSNTAITVTNATFSEGATGVIAGTGGLTVQSNTAVTLNGANTYSGNTAVTGGSLTLNGSISNSAITVTNATFSEGAAGVIGGTSGLTVQSNGVVTLNGANSYSGTTTVGGGTLTVGATGGLGTNNLTIQTGGAVVFSGGSNVINGALYFKGSTGGTGSSMTLLGGSTVTQVGNYDYWGNNSAGNATLTLGANSLLTLSNATLVQPLSGTFLLTNSGGTVAIGNGQQIRMQAGSGGLAELAIGSGTVTAGGGNSGIMIGGGYNGESVGGTNLLLVTGGLVNLTNSTLSTYMGGGSTNSVNQLTLNGGQVILNSITFGAQTGYATTIGATNIITLGGGTMTIGNFAISSSYSNGMTTNGIVFNGGTLQAGASSGSTFLGSGVSNTTITLSNNGGVFDANGFNNTVAVAVNGTGNLTVSNTTGSGTLTLSGVNTYYGNTILTNNSALALGGAGQLGGGNYTGQIQLASGAQFIDASTATQTLSGAISGAGSLTVNGSGNLILAASNSYTGQTLVSAGTLILTNGGDLRNTLVTIGSTNSSSGAVFNNYGIVSNVTVGLSTAAVGSATNFYNKGTILGQLNIVGGTNSAGSYSAPTAVNWSGGGAFLDSGTVATNIVANGNLYIGGSGSMSVSGITGANTATNSYAVAGTNFYGMGIINVASTYTNANSQGGNGNVLSFANGFNSFSGFSLGAGSGNGNYITLVGSGSTNAFGAFGYTSTASPVTNGITFSGGTWLLDVIGQNNSGSKNSSTHTITNGAVVNVATNYGYVGAPTFNINQGSLNFTNSGGSTVANSLNLTNNSLSFYVGGNGTFTDAAGLTLGNGNANQIATGQSSVLSVNGGQASIAGAVVLGRGYANTNEVSALSVSNGGSIVISNSLALGDSTNHVNQSNTVTLAGGSLTVTGTMATGSGASGASNSFFWNGGTFSAGTITASNTASQSAWTGSAAGSSISNNTLYNTNTGNNLWVGNTSNGYAGKTIVTGNYNQGGSGTATFNIFGTNQATSWIGGTTNYSFLTNSGAASLAGSIVANFGTFTPATNNSFTLIGAAGGLTSTASLGGSNAYNGYAFWNDGLNYSKISTNATTLSLVYGGLNQWQGGTGTWDATTNNWTAGVNPNGTNFVAYFGTNGAGGSITVSGNKTNSSLILSNNAVGYTLNGPGSLTLGNAGTANLTSYGSNVVNPNIALNGQLNVGGTGSLNLAGNISGNYGLVDSKSGTVTLGGSNSYVGSTLITNGGTLIATTTNSFGSTANWNNVTVNGSTLALAFGTGGWNQTSLSTLLGQASITNNSTVSLDSTLGGGTLTTSLSGGYALGIQGTGTITLEGDNSGVSNGITLISGTLAVDNKSSANALGGGSSTLTLMGNNAQKLDLGGTTQSLNSITVNAATTGVLTLTNGTLSLANGSPAVFAGLNEASNASISAPGTYGIFLGASPNAPYDGGVSKFPLNALAVQSVLAGSNNISNIQIGAGGVQLENANALGSGTFWIAGSSTVSSVGGFTNAGALSVDMSSTSLQLTAQGNLNFGQAVLAIGSGINTLNVSSGVLTFTNGVGNGNYSGAGQIVKQGNGTLVLGGSSTASGTTLNGGTILALGANSLGANLTLASGLLDLGNNNDTFGTVAFNGSGFQITNGSITATSGYTASNAAISLNLSGNGATFTAGGGTVTLTGANTYTGATVVTNGTLYSTFNAGTTYMVTNSGSTFVAGVAIDPTWTAAGVGSITLNPGTTLAIDATGTNFALTASLTNGANAILGTYGTGTVTLADPQTNYSAISKIVVSSGTLDLGGVVATNQMTLTNVTISGGTVKNGTLSTTNLTIASNANATIAANLIGSALTFGNGQNITLAGSNGFIGLTIGSNSSVSFAASSAVGSSTNGFTINAGGQAFFTNSGTTNTVASANYQNINITGAGNLTPSLVVSNGATLLQNRTGNGGANETWTSANVLVGSNGTLSITQQYFTLQLNSGTKVQVDAGGSMSVNGSGFTVGGANGGTNTVTNAGSLTIGATTFSVGGGATGLNQFINTGSVTNNTGFTLAGTDASTSTNFVSNSASGIMVGTGSSAVINIGNKASAQNLFVNAGSASFYTVNIGNGSTNAFNALTNTGTLTITNLTRVGLLSNSTTNLFVNTGTANLNYIEVGDQSAALNALSNGGTMSGSYLYMGSANSLLSIVTNSGNLTLNNKLIVGNSGGATNILVNSGTITNSAGLVVGNSALTGTNLVTNTSTGTMTFSQVVVGGNGSSSSLNSLVNNGGTVIDTGAGSTAFAIGNSTNATGLNQVILNGGVITNSGATPYILLGNAAAASGTNQLLISNGGSFYGFQTRIGVSGSQYNLISNNGGIYANRDGGYFDVGDGSSNNANTVSIGNGTLSIGANGQGLKIGNSGSGSTNQVTLASGGVINASNTIYLGSGGANNSNTLTVNSGAFVNGGGYAVGSGGNNSYNLLQITGSGTVTGTSQFYLGSGGVSNTNTMSVASGGVYSNSSTIQLQGINSTDLFTNSGGSVTGNFLMMGAYGASNSSITYGQGSGTTTLGANGINMANYAGNLGNSSTNTIVVAGGTFTSTNGSTVLGSAGTNNVNTIEVDGGQMNLSTVSLGATNSTISSGGTNQLNLNGGTLSLKQITAGAASIAAGSSNQVNLNGGTLLAASGASTNFIGSGVASVNLGLAGGTFDSSTNAITIGAIIGGSGALTKAGTGTLTLSAGNTYSGGSTLNGGALNITSGSSLGSGNISLSGGSKLAYTGLGAASINNNIGNLSGNAIIANSSASTLTLFGNLSDSGNLLTLASGTFNVNGTISGAYSLSNATVNLSSSYSYSAPTSILAGSTLNLGGNDNLTTGSVLNFGASTDLSTHTNTLNLAGYNQSVASIGNNGGSGVNQIVDNSLSGGGTFTILGNSSFGGSIGGLTTTASQRNLNLTVGNNANVNLTGKNTYTGSTTIQNGAVLDLGGGGSLTGTSNVIANGGTLLLGGNGRTNSVNSSSTLELNGGTLSMGGANATSRTASQTFASLTLTLTDNSTINYIDFADRSGSSTLIFSSIAMNGNTLYVFDWNGTNQWGTTSTTGGAPTYLYDSTLNDSGLNLADIKFYAGKDTSSQFLGYGNQITSGQYAGEIVPVPEPSVIIAAMMLLGWLLFANRGMLTSLIHRRLA